MNVWDPRSNAIFLKAIELPKLGERRAYAAEACEGDAGLTTLVVALLDFALIAAHLNAQLLYGPRRSYGLDFQLFRILAQFVHGDPQRIAGRRPK